MRRGDIVWVVVGAWMCSMAGILHGAMPHGFYLDGKRQHWAPAWIPTVIGLMICSIGLIPSIAAYWPRRKPGNSRLLGRLLAHDVRVKFAEREELSKPRH